MNPIRTAALFFLLTFPLTTRAGPTVPTTPPALVAPTVPAPSTAPAATASPGPLAAPASMGMGLLDLLSLQQGELPPPGTWVELAVTAGGVEVGPYLRFIVAAPDPEGVWIELWISQRPGSGSQAFRLLLAPEEGGRFAVRRVTHRLLGGEPVELPLEDEMLAEAEGRGATGHGAARPAGTRRLRTAARQESVLTHAGTFRAERVEVWEGDEHVSTLWRSAAVPLFNLVKADFGGVLGMEVHGMGHDSPFLF